jgi:hypothetical protein
MRQPIHRDKNKILKSKNRLTRRASVCLNRFRLALKSREALQMAIPILAGLIERDYRAAKQKEK